MKEDRLLGRRHPAERDIAMGKAAEAFDDLLVAQHILELILRGFAPLRRAFRQPGAKKLDRDRLVRRSSLCSKGR
jgi:hypothetical protein